MKRYAIIKNGVVENVIDYIETPTNPPAGFSEGYIAVQSDIVGPNWLYKDGVLIDTSPPPAPIILEDQLK